MEPKDQPDTAQSPSSRASALAQSILAQEAASAPEPEHETVAKALNKFRDGLVRMVGAAGYQALLSRSFAVASAKYPNLRNLQICPDGSLEPRAVAETDLPLPRDPDAQLRDQSALLEEFLLLLETFIGSELTMRLVGAIWPVEVG